MDLVHFSSRLRVVGIRGHRGPLHGLKHRQRVRGRGQVCREEVLRDLAARAMAEWPGHTGETERGRGKRKHDGNEENEIYIWVYAGISI
jgi:hypothetical protein